MLKNSFFLTLVLLVLNYSAFSQRNVKDSIIGTPWIAVHYGGNIAAGDLADRYGYINHLGVLGGYKTPKNWFYGIDGSFYFSSQTNFPTIFDGLRDSQGNLTDVNGDIAKVFLLMRGFNANLTVGKVFPVFGSNKNSGIFLHGGLGVLMHKLRIESNNNVIPELELEYKKGYDRLTIGPNFHEFVGYAFMANSGVLNFYGGFYAQQGLTQNKRNIFYDQPDIPVDKSTRLDLQFGFRLGWFIPIYKRQPKEFYYN